MSELIVQTCTSKSAADLAVQKKKIVEVRDWMLSEHGPGLLLLSGAAAAIILLHCCPTVIGMNRYMTEDPVYCLLQDPQAVGKPQQCKLWLLSWA